MLIAAEKRKADVKQENKLLLKKKSNIFLSQAEKRGVLKEGGKLSKQLAEQQYKKPEYNSRKEDELVVMYLQLEQFDILTMFYIVGLKENKYFLLYTFLGNSEINLPFFFFYFYYYTFNITNSKKIYLNETKKKRNIRRLNL